MTIAKSTIRDGLLERAVNQAVEALSGQTEEITTVGLVRLMENIASEEKKNLLNHIAQLDVLRWKVIRSVHGFAERGSGWSEQKFAKLLDRGLESAAEIFPSLNDNLLLKQQVTAKLSRTIRLLREGSAEQMDQLLLDVREIIQVSPNAEEALRNSIESIVNSKERSAANIKNRFWRIVQSETATADRDEVKDRLLALAKKIANANTDQRPDGEKLSDFMAINMLLRPTDRFAVSPLSGPMPGFISLPMEALESYLSQNEDRFPRYAEIKKRIIAVEKLKLDEDMKELHRFAEQQREAELEDMKRLYEKSEQRQVFADNFNSHAVQFLHRFICDPPRMSRQLERQFRKNNLVSVPTIRTDGYQISVTFIDLSRPNAAQAKFLTEERSKRFGNPGGKATTTTIETVSAADAEISTCGGDCGDQEAVPVVQSDQIAPNIADDIEMATEDITEEAADGDINSAMGTDVFVADSVDVLDELDCLPDENNGEANDDPGGGGNDPGGGGGGGDDGNGDDNNDDAGNNNGNNDDDESDYQPEWRLADIPLETTEISKYLAQNPHRSSEIRTIMAVDEGIRFPIAASIITMPDNGPVTGHSRGSKQRFLVRKGHLYQYETQCAAKLEYLKSEWPENEIHKAENELGLTGTKNSLNWKRFENGYLAMWIRHQTKLFDFYSLTCLRGNRMHCDVRRQSLYDNLVNKLFTAMGVKQWKGRSDWHAIINKSKLVVLGQQRVSTRHKGHRPSKHAVFWRYFAKKAMAINIDVVGLTEFRSSKVCMKCCRRIEHDKDKNYRVYYCDHCEHHVHRDDSSAEIHCAVAWSEVIGYSEALANDELPQYDPDNRTTIRYFRPKLFQSSWMLSLMKNAATIGASDPVEGSINNAATTGMSDPAEGSVLTIPE